MIVNGSALLSILIIESGVEPSGSEIWFACFTQANYDRKLTWIHKSKQ